jgi:hypothetical protein
VINSCDLYTFCQLSIRRACRRSITAALQIQRFLLVYFMKCVVLWSSNAIINCGEVCAEDHNQPPHSGEQKSTESSAAGKCTAGCETEHIPTALLLLLLLLQVNKSEQNRLRQAGAQLAPLGFHLQGPAKPQEMGVGPLRMWPGGLCVSRCVTCCVMMLQCFIV